MLKCLPYADDSSRVLLTPIPNVEGSDYINASYIDVSTSLPLSSLPLSSLPSPSSLSPPSFPVTIPYLSPLQCFQEEREPSFLGPHLLHVLPKDPCPITLLGHLPLEGRGSCPGPQHPSGPQAQAECSPDRAGLC